MRKVLPKLLRPARAAISRWNSMSLASSASRRRRLMRYLMRRNSSPMVGLLIWCRVRLCGAENVLNGLGYAIVFRQLGLQVLAAVRREAVEADLAIGLGDAPLRGDPALDEHLLQRGIEQALFDSEDFAGEQVNTLGDCVSVQRTGLKHPEDEHGECAGRHSRFRHIEHRHKIFMPTVIVKQERTLVLWV